MKTKDSILKDTEYVLYDKANDSIVCFDDGKPMIYGTKQEAIEDCYGNEYVVSCTDLPEHKQKFLIKKLNLKQTL